MRSLSIAGFALPRIRAALPGARLPAARPGRRTARIVLVKPSKYDDTGCVLSFRWGVLPSNTLVVLAGLTEAYRRERPQIDLQLVLWDELVDGVLTPERIAGLVARARGDGVELLVGIVGVQSNQYPRGRDVALELRALGVPVAMGGFHVTTHAGSRAFLAAAGVTTVVGEAEPTWSVLLDDWLAGRLERTYAIADGIRARTGTGEVLVPDIARAPLPWIDARYRRSFLNPSFSTIDTSRGCPFVCSYCSVKNVMGRSMRAREPERVVAWVRDAHDRHGIRNLLLVDDDFFRSPVWRQVLRGIAELRRSGRAVSFIMQTDLEASLGAHGDPGDAMPRARRSREFVELCAAAGCFQAFVGLESFDPENLRAAAKFQNRATGDRRATRATSDEAQRVAERYREAVDGWHRAGIAVHAGYIVGMPHDGPGCGTAAARRLRAIGVDLASFFVATPLPGSEDHVAAERAGEITDHDFNNFDSAHLVRRHPRMSRDEVMREYDAAYRAFYGWPRLLWSLGTLHGVPGLRFAARSGMVTHHLYYGYAIRRGWHPMMGGVWRVREPAARRRAVGDAEAAAAYGVEVSRSVLDGERGAHGV